MRLDVLRSSLPIALQQCSRELRRRWLDVSDEMMRLRGFPMDRTKPYCKEEVDAISAKTKLIATQGTGPVLWRMWLADRDDESGQPVYPVTELRCHDDGLSVHLVASPTTSEEK